MLKNLTATLFALLLTVGCAGSSKEAEEPTDKPDVEETATETEGGDVTEGVEEGAEGAEEGAEGAEEGAEGAEEGVEGGVEGGE